MFKKTWWHKPNPEGVSPLDALKVFFVFGILYPCILLSLNSCQRNVRVYKDAPTQFVVIDTAKYYGMNTFTTYEVEVVDANSINHDGNGNNLRFVICDTAGKYKIGQPIHFNHN